MHTVSTNQIADIMHFNDNEEYNPFFYESSKQIRTSSNCFLSLIRYWLSRLYESL